MTAVNNLGRIAAAEELVRYHAGRAAPEGEPDAHRVSTLRRSVDYLVALVARVPPEQSGYPGASSVGRRR